MDGTLDIANGADAQEILNWWTTAEQIALQHGAHYRGGKLRRIECITMVDEPGDELVISETGAKHLQVQQSCPTD
jgi:hypothetical protein